MTESSMPVVHHSFCNAVEERNPFLLGFRESNFRVKKRVIYILKLKILNMSFRVTQHSGVYREVTVNCMLD
jgi:hypothetical protein